MECPNCHTDNVEGVGFCSSCGTSLASASVPVVPSVGLAGRGSRLVAVIIDWIIIGGPIILGAMIIPPLAAVSPPVLVIGLALVALFVPAAIFIYQLVLLTRYGQTLGKKVVGIRIVKSDTGENAGFVPNVLLRLIVNLLLVLIIPFYQLVDILFIFRGDRWCIHDMYVGIQVVKV